MEKPSSESSVDQLTAAEVIDPVADEVRPTSTLIAFPGVSRQVPEWRKQLSQRVREVQEQRAREAAEAATARLQAEAVSCALPSAQLELVPDPEQPALNPIVSKALERVERARKSDFAPNGFAATATAPALARMPDESEPEQSHLPLTPPKPNLVVVTKGKPKPVRVISDDADDASLGYLDSYLSIPALKDDTENHASFARRVTAALLDFILLSLVISPAVAAIELTGRSWADPRLIGFLCGAAIAVFSTYLTLAIAFTGRTIGMRWLSLRAIDIRTGLIPTGGQSIRRTIGYLLSLAPLGLGVIYALVDPDQRTLHDRFSKTTVVRA